MLNVFQKRRNAFILQFFGITIILYEIKRIANYF